VPAQSALSSTPLPAPVVRRIRERLKEQLQSILQPEDQIAYLILETHGSTSEKHESFLEMMGSFSSEGPDEEFREIFDPIRTRLASNAAVIMSACEIFADGEAQASLRAQALLSYFGARDGVVYGSKFDEVDTLQTQGKYFSWKSPYVREKVQRAAFFNSGFTVVMATIAAIAGAHPLTALTVSTVTSALTAAMQYSWIRHADSEISEYARLNRGYLLQFKDGQMRSIEFIHKMKDLAKSFGIKRACSMIY
jgi:hypothetical protein